MKNKDEKVIHINSDNAEKLKSAQQQDLRKDSRFEWINGKLKKSSMKNVVLLLQNDIRLKNKLRYNEFTMEIDVVENIELPTKSMGTFTIKQGQIDDNANNNLVIYFEDSTAVSFQKNLIESALLAVAHQNSYNPLRDYMDDAYKKWDHVKRIDEFFHDYLGVEKNPATLLIARLFFKGAVGKVYNPLMKFDYDLDLVGAQGVGKTSCFQNLAPLGYYTDQFNNFIKPDDLVVMKNALIVNDDEMTASNKASFEELKKFSTTRWFEFRRAYYHHPEKFPRHFVLVRTTNEIQYLRDKTGVRRFLPLLCNKEHQLKSPVTDLDPSTVEQLWGEAVHLYKDSNEPFSLTQEQSDMLDKYRKPFQGTSEIEDELNSLLENEFRDRDFISNKEIRNGLFRSLDHEPTTKEIKQVRYLMINLNYKAGASGYDRTNHKQAKGFKKRT